MNDLACKLIQLASPNICRDSTALSAQSGNILPLKIRF